MLADLDDGPIGIGRATTCGYGSVRAGLSTAEAAAPQRSPDVASHTRRASPGEPMNETTEPRTDGRMTWDEAMTGPLAAATCLWQDLDGVHIEPSAAEPPPTSILWAWNDHVMIRVRLDGTEAYVATFAAPYTAAPTLPWGLETARSSRYASPQGSLPGNC